MEDESIEEADLIEQNLLQLELERSIAILREEESYNQTAMNNRKKKVMTLVLVGKAGNGKSSTGNSILNRKAFEAKTSFSSVTMVSEVQQKELPDRLVNIIDTPGLFDPQVPFTMIKNEISKCIELAKGGIHAVLMVVTLSNRFTTEEATTLDILKTIFGERILEYVIVVFTHEDRLEEEERAAEEIIVESPHTLKDALRQCGNRYVVFDNKTRCEEKKATQIDKLITIVDDLMTNNDGCPYTHHFFEMAQEIEKRRHIEEAYQQTTNQLREELDEKLRMAIKLFEERLAAEESARARASEKQAEQEHELGRIKQQQQQQQSLIPIIWGRLKQELKNTEANYAALRSQHAGGGCSIL